ncbi:phosphoribosylformylglycinamidine synthase subunit PurQ [Pseudoclavibacter sp. 13-3]|uniref:phosphoribosylformylglycinamidine synthase subunit PurQ n=1 Tax=Pseudoclavibacter sp. 13-3 TaxID=2901228 RepID=UPI001E469A90|nr:phosphoribosylformylglycinamidine synthase subunit PurQ [Pseudoclavibacter sp. 13-3]MCD7101463.1 phosphoribosylformylglycinamidine synthase subunit PurQ [Pseudoclavibacter sp. 13-3]
MADATTASTARPARIGVVTFPGTLDDGDARRAVRFAGAEAVALWHADTDISGVDAIVLPGGFSYGDYLRAGALATQSPIMRSIVEAANDGLPVLGICNGFQVLTESHLLPGALVRNEHLHFIRHDQSLRIESSETAWTNGYERGQEIVIPLKNAEGRYVADETTLQQLEDDGRIIARYIDGNPNGSAHDIAGITNAAGNVVGLMPHPEHAIVPGFGPDTAERMRSGTDGLTFFTSVLAHLGIAPVDDVVPASHAPEHHTADAGIRE